MKTVKSVKSVVVAAAMVAAVLAFGNARAEGMVLVVESCADMQCVVDSINDEILAEAEWSLNEQVKRMDAQFAQPMFVSANTTRKSRGSWQEDFNVGSPSQSIRVN